LTRSSPTPTTRCSRTRAVRSQAERGYLRRAHDSLPDANFTGYNFWFTKLNQFNGNYINAEMVKAFASSIEYKQRFDQP
jgi:cytochrome c biogenesis protein ResB